MGNSITCSLRQATLAATVFPLLDVVAAPLVVRDDPDALGGPAVIVANHVSHLDCPAVLRSLPRRLRRRVRVAAASDYFYRNKLTSAMSTAVFGTVPLQRGGDGTASLDRLAEALRAGSSVLIFPEGTRSRTGELQRFHRGAARLALLVGVPIIPIGTAGLDSVLPKGTRCPRPGRTAVRVGTPVWPTDADSTSLTLRVEHEVRALRAEAAALLRSRHPQWQVVSR